MRMLVNVNNHINAELELRIRNGKRIVEAAMQNCKEALDNDNINAACMHEAYGNYILQCISQAQQELDKRRA